MLQAIVSWSIHNRVAVLVLAGLSLATGMVATMHARLDVFPEFAPPQVIVQTEAPGMLPEQVEQRITQPIENEINGLPHLSTLRSQSIQGLSVVTAIFQDGTDIYRARQLVNERLSQLGKAFPAEVKPRTTPLTSSTGRLLTIGFTSAKLSPLELRDQAQWNIRPRLLRVPGVAQVTIYGGDVRQFQVQLIPERLLACNLAPEAVLDATRRASGVSGAGFQERNGQRLILRVEGQVRSAQELAQSVLTTSEGTPVHLGDVARVTEGTEPKFGDGALYDDLVERLQAGGRVQLPRNEPAVILVISKQIDEDTRETTRRVEEELAQLQPVVERLGIHYHPGLFRQADFIERAIANVSESLIIGAILVSVVLFIFLFNLRTALISLTAIPLSLLAAITVLWAWGVGLNTLTLGGLAIAVGEVVDDAIIDVENIYRRLQENAGLPQPRSRLQVVLDASLEVRTAVVYATFIVVLVFLPVFFMSGLQGRLFAPLGYAYVLAVLASLAVAITVTPALALALLHFRRRDGAAQALLAEPWLLRQVQSGYVWLLRRLDKEFVLVSTVALLLIAAAVWSLFETGGEFLPELRDTHFTIHMRGLPGTSLAESRESADRVTQLLKTDPDLGKYIRSLALQAGRAELGEDTAGVEYSEIELDLYPVGAKEVERLQRDIKSKLQRCCAGFSIDVLPFLTERINEILSGTNAQFAVRIYGDNLETLDRTAQRVAQMLARIKTREPNATAGGAEKDLPAATTIRVEVLTGVPELAIRIRAEDAGRLGIQNQQILDAVHAAFQGAEIGQVTERNRVIDLTVVLNPAARDDIQAVADLWLTVPPAGPRPPRAQAAVEGASVDTPSQDPLRIRLKEVADVFLADGRFMIAHEGGLRRQIVSCNVRKGCDLETFARKAEAGLQSMSWPAGISYESIGEHTARRTAQRELLLLSLAAGTGIVLLLWMVFGSVRHLLLVLVNLPFALVGGIAAVYLMGGNLNVGSLVGFVTLFGITMRNGIMMVAHWQHLHEVEGVAWGPELVLRGARERLAPVLMTALVTALGLLPIALGSGEAGKEIEGPMAMVILGGLVTSTALNLIVLPVLYRRLGGGASAAVMAQP